MKKLLTFIMSLAIAGSVCMISSFADNVSAESVGVEDPVFKWDWEKIGGVNVKEEGEFQLSDNLSVNYIIMPDDTIYLRSFNGSYDGELIIPSEINGYAVTEIGSNAFNDCTWLTSVIIPDSVNRIWYGAFRGCSELESVNIPDGITVIEADTFKDCTSLSTITVADSVNEIERGAFENCTSLDALRTVVNTDDGNKYITENESLFVNDKIKVTGYDAFKNTKWYNSQKDGLVFTGNIVGAPDAFSRGSRNLYNYKGSVPENSTVDIPYIVESISEYAFDGQTGMTSVILPDRIDRIRPFTFNNCTGLTEVTIPENVVTVMVYAFNGCSGLQTVTIEDGTKNIQREAFADCSALSKIVIPESVSYIADEAFSGCSQDLTIYGYKDSAAEKYAQVNSIRFVLLDSNGAPVTTAVSSSSSSGTTSSTTAAGTSSSSKSNNSSPNTGDRGISLIAALGAAAAALSVILFKRNRKNMPPM